MNAILTCYCLSKNFNFATFSEDPDFTLLRQNYSSLYHIKYTQYTPKYKEVFKIKGLNFNEIYIVG
jgi:hypothetical protein